MTETESTKATKQAKSYDLKFDKRTIIYVLFYMLFVFMLVALLMPRSQIIGIVLQILAGLIFLVYQFREKILERNLIEKLTKALNNTAFQSNLPLLVIPFIVPLALVLYFRFGSTDIPWVEALISITVATSFSCFFYLFAVVNTQRWVQRLVHWIGRKLDKAVNERYPNYLLANSILFILSLVFLMLIFWRVLIPVLSANSSTLSIALFALVMAALMFFGYIFFLSLLYFVLFIVLKSAIALSRVRLNLSDTDKARTQQLFWAFLLASWLWGGILIAVNI